MKKIFKLCLSFLIVTTMIGCQSQKKKVAEVLEKQGYTIQRQEQFKTVQRTVNLVSSDKKTVVCGQFKLDKSLIGIGYGEGGDYYYAPELVSIGFTSNDVLKSKYENWLKEMDISEEDLKAYLTDINSKTREPVDIQSNIDPIDLKGEIRKPEQSRYDDFYLYSEKKKVFMDAFIKDGKVLTFTFANETYGADKLFVYTNNKVFKDEGVGGYMLFLYDLNITHEEFMDYLENVYNVLKNDTEK